MDANSRALSWNVIRSHWICSLLNSRSRLNLAKSSPLRARNASEHAILWNPLPHPHSQENMLTGRWKEALTCSLHSNSSGILSPLWLLEASPASLLLRSIQAAWGNERMCWQKGTTPSPSLSFRTTVRRGWRLERPPGGSGGTASGELKECLGESKEMKY